MTKVKHHDEEDLRFDGMTLPPFPPLLKNAKERFEEIRNLETRDDDIIITGFPKSGNFWVWEIVSMLFDGRTDYTKEGRISAFLEGVKNFTLIKNLTSPRSLNTHVPYRWLPKCHVQNEGKIIHIIRNPKDIAVTMFYHFQRSQECTERGERRFDDCIDDMISDKEQLYGGWFAYEKEFERSSEGKHAIHLLQYERLEKTPSEEIRRLAEFLKISYSETLIDAITRHYTGTVESGSTNNIHNIMTGVHPSFKQDLSETGEWKNYFTVAQNERFDKFYNKMMKGTEVEAYVL